MNNYQDACPTFKISAVDVHGHYGINFGDGSDQPLPYGSGSAETVSERARRSNVHWTIVSPLNALMNGQILAGNEQTARVVEEVDGLLQWAVLSPLLQESFEQVRDLIQTPKCVGIKIHPQLHDYRIAEHGREIFGFAARHNLIVKSHSGEYRSMPEDFVPFLDEFPEVRLIVAHLGCSDDKDSTHQVRAIQMSKHRNIYTDTSSAMNINPGLLEWAVGEIGSDRILFGTDTPLYSVPMQRARIDWAEISDQDKQNILTDNAVKLFGGEIE